MPEFLHPRIRIGDIEKTVAFYEPLGMTRACFKPLDHFDVKEIAPSEEDNVFRKQRLQGFVHDSGSAMMGGVGGHAGLFSNAENLAILILNRVTTIFFKPLIFLRSHQESGDV